MSKITPSEEVNFLLLCIDHSERGKVSWPEVGAATGLRPGTAEMRLRRMKAKTGPTSEDVSFLHECLVASRCTKINWKAVGGAMKLKPGTAEMRYRRLKTRLENVKTAELHGNKDVGAACPQNPKVEKSFNRSQTIEVKEERNHADEDLGELKPSKAKALGKRKRCTKVKIETTESMNDESPDERESMPKCRFRKGATHKSLSESNGMYGPPNDEGASINDPPAHQHYKEMNNYQVHSDERRSPQDQLPPSAHVNDAEAIEHCFTFTPINMQQHVSPQALASRTPANSNSDRLPGLRTESPPLPGPHIEDTQPMYYENLLQRFQAASRPGTLSPSLRMRQTQAASAYPAPSNVYGPSVQHEQDVALTPSPFTHSVTSFSHAPPHGCRSSSNSLFGDADNNGREFNLFGEDSKDYL